LHYLQEGAAQGFDPHPLFDTKTYLKMAGRIPRDTTPLEVFIRSGAVTVAGAYRSVASLEEIQRDFLARVQIECLHDRRTLPARWAVWLQCGRQSLHPQWLTGREKPWHLIANVYDDTYNREIDADVILRQNIGTKFSAIYYALKKRPDLLSSYDYVFLLDDDILVSEEEITRFFEVVEVLGLDLAQPSVQEGSAYTWPVLLQEPRSIGRYLNAVEIMMPVLSRKVLAQAGFLFGRSISGWGIDFALGKVIREAFGPRKIGIIDAVSFAHTKAINTAGGAYYDMLHRNGISPLVEERVIGSLYGAVGPIDLA